MLPTTLSRFNELESPFDQMRQEMDRLLGRWSPALLSGNGGEQTALAYPVDMQEDDQKIYIQAEMPGLKADDIEVTLEEGVLSISGEHSEEKEKKKGKSRMHERQYCRIERSFRLPSTVNEDAVKAEMKDGVLHLELQKSPESKPRRIAVR